MSKKEQAVEKHKKGYNCAQAVLCVFAEKLGYSEDTLFKLSEAFGGGMGGTQGVCGAVSAMVFVVGAIKSYGIDKIPETNKKVSYDFARMIMEKFENEVGTILCAEIKNKQQYSCDECVEKAVELLEQFVGE